MAGRLGNRDAAQFKNELRLAISAHGEVMYAAHVIGHCDRATIAAPVGDVTASISQLRCLGIIWKPDLVSPENKQRIELAFGIVEALGKETRFFPACVRLLGHAVREHHATVEYGLNDHFLP